MKNYTLGIIGCGNMAQAILKALTGPDGVAMLNENDRTLTLTASDPDTAKLENVRALGITTTQDNAKLVNGSDYILLAVKPQVAADAVKGLDFRGKIVISIMAGISLQGLGAMTKADKLVRVMPNLNARVGKSFNAYCTQNLAIEEEKTVSLLLSSFGKAQQVKESSMNAVTGLTGSAPAFVFQFVEAFVDAGIYNGFTPAEALEMALTTIEGSLATIRSDSAVSLPELIDSVCSKGGTTIEGVRYLKEQNFNGTIGQAIENSIRRAAELDKKA